MVLLVPGVGKGPLPFPDPGLSCSPLPKARLCREWGSKAGSGGRREEGRALPWGPWAPPPSLPDPGTGGWSGLGERKGMALTPGIRGIGSQGGVLERQAGWVEKTDGSGSLVGGSLFRLRGGASLQSLAAGAAQGPRGRRGPAGPGFRGPWKAKLQGKGVSSSHAHCTMAAESQALASCRLHREGALAHCGGSRSCWPVLPGRASLFLSPSGLWRSCCSHTQEDALLPGRWAHSRAVWCPSISSMGGFWKARESKGAYCPPLRSLWPCRAHLVSPDGVHGDGK